LLDFPNDRFLHETDLPRCPQFGRYREESGHGGYERRLPSLTRSGLERPLSSLIRSSSRRGRDRLDDIRCAPVINSLLPRATSVVSPWAAQPVPIPTSATIVAPNSAFVIARTTTIVIPRSARQAWTDDTGTVTVRSPPVVSTGNAGNAQGGQGSTDLRLSTLDRQRDAALRRAAKGE
jgi:hypothetical protein